jgi:hypothetical protein
MSTDDGALGLFSAMRPTPPALSPDIRRAQVSAPNGQVDLHSLAVVPGTPGYNSRIPKPPCYQCGDDHHPGVDYGHDWMPEPVTVVHDEPVSATAMRRPQVYDPQPVQATVAEIPQQRVALYVGRGDTYVICVETAPDWDAVQTFKVSPLQVPPMISMARALGTKIMDKTGGDLLMLEQENNDARSQSPQTHDRGAEGSGDRGPRRPGPAAVGAEVDQPEED